MDRDEKISKSRILNDEMDSLDTERNKIIEDIQNTISSYQQPDSDLFERVDAIDERSHELFQKFKKIWANN